MVGLKRNFSWSGKSLNIDSVREIKGKAGKINMADLMPLKAEKKHWGSPVFSLMKKGKLLKTYQS